jgi:alkanesulfonate monooxygenase
MDDRRAGQLSLGAFIHPTGNHVAAWLHPDSQIDAGTNFEHYVALAQMAEAAKFDLMFMADSAATRDGKLSALSRWPQYMAYFEPPIMMAALAGQTKRLGLVATATTSYHEPYNVARTFANIDHISHGRAGWNVVTSSNTSEAYNFGREAHFEHGERYARAQEFVAVVKGLWDSWEDDAFLRDRATARYFDPEKLHHLHHKGKFFSVRGPLNAARPPQGYPVISQAGSSEESREMAAETAELMFSPQWSIESAQAFYRDVKGRMARYGRQPDEMKIMPGLNAIVGRTMAEAQEKHRFLQSLIHPEVGCEVLSAELGGTDLSDCDVDGPLPYDRIPTASKFSQATINRVVAMARQDNLTIRQLYEKYCGARGQRTLIGTAEFIAENMISWFEAYAVDGFLVHPAYLPGELREITQQLIPELQTRGYFRADYAGTTLREHLGLKRPANRYAAARGA